jgi:VWFA-related protein
MLNRIDPEEQVGLYSFDRDGLKVVNEVGSSRVAMVQSLKTLFGQPSPCFQSTLTIVDEPDSMGDCGGKVMVGQGELVPDPLGREFLTFMVEQRSRATIRAFEAISAHLAGLPGRKSLIWVSAGFPRRLALRGGGFIDYTPQVNRAVRKLNGANTSVYPVDARGLTQVDPRLNSDIDTWSMMDEFAERTGGKSFYGDNGLDVGMQAAIEDVQASYTLGFYAPQDNSRAGFHKLTVRTLRPGVKLRYKEGYYVDEPGKISKDDRKNGVSEALTALMDATSIPIEIKASRQNNAVKLRVSLRPDALALVQKGDRWQGAVEFITRFAKEDGSESAPPVSRRIEFNLTQRTYEAARRGGLLFSRTLEMPAKVASLRVLVRNDPSGEIGTLTIPAKDIAQ